MNPTIGQRQMDLTKQNREVIASLRLPKVSSTSVTLLDHQMGAQFHFASGLWWHATFTPRRLFTCDRWFAPSSVF